MLATSPLGVLGVEASLPLLTPPSFSPPLSLIPAAVVALAAATDRRLPLVTIGDLLVVVGRPQMTISTSLDNKSRPVKHDPYNCHYRRRRRRRRRNEEEEETE